MMIGIIPWWCILFYSLSGGTVIIVLAQEGETTVASVDDGVYAGASPQDDYPPEPDKFTTTISNTPISIEILRIYVPFESGNSVKLIWGKLLGYQSNLTYSVHYGLSENELREPKLTTTEPSALVEDLEFCTKYMFAVNVVSNENPTINPNNVRTIVTQIDPLAAPQDLQIDFEPREDPSLLIKWSASCPSFGDPIGYIISAYERRSARYIFLTVQPSTRFDLAYSFNVDYEDQFHIKVSTMAQGAQHTEPIPFKVPSFLQPYKLKVTANPDDGAFLIYWSEPFVPYYVGKYYYQVNIYTGDSVSNDLERYFVTRPVLIHKGNSSVYTFIVGTVSLDGGHRSLFTRPLVANINGDTHEIEEEENVALLLDDKWNDG